jgi:hypothetical protein
MTPDVKKNIQSTGKKEFPEKQRVGIKLKTGGQKTTCEKKTTNLHAKY